MTREQINFRLSDFRNECEEYSRSRGERISTTLIKGKMNSSFFANSKRNYMLDTGDMSGEFGRASVSFYDAVCKAFKIDPLKYAIIEGDEEEPEEVEETAQNGDLIEILKAINTNLEMLGKICVQNHIDIMDMKDFWK